jgi:DNA-binding NtrC family response regulator
MGETGTGKELFARAIHYHSARQGQPFIPVNCGALPDHLFENELFGHAKGAFTDASSEENGLIAEAEGGTLLLDEVDVLSPAAQVKLLRFLQDREYRRVGSPKVRVADVRILAATNADLAALVEAKRFRGDLYYRLNILSLSLPPLRERTGDIAFLAHHFLMKFKQHYAKDSLEFVPGALQELLSYAWPGNVRELEAVIERAVVMADSPYLGTDDLSLPSSPPRESAPVSSLREAKTAAIRQFEKSYLSNLLLSHQGNITRAAKSAGKKRQTLQKLLRKYGLERQAFESSSK